MYHATYLTFIHYKQPWDFYRFSSEGFKVLFAPSMDTTGFSARVVHYDLSMGLPVIAGITAFVMQAIPTTPAGIGVHEGTIAGVLMIFGVSADIGTSIVLVDHLYSFLASSPQST